MGHCYHLQNLEIEGENNNNWTINVPSLSTNQFQISCTNEPNTSRQKTILTKIIQRQPINNSTSIYPTTLEPKSMLRIGFTALISLLSVTYKINGNGNLIPTALFHKLAITFTLFLFVFMVIFYLAAIGMVLEEAFPKITKVINIISFIFIVLGAPYCYGPCWIPWIFFACTAGVIFGVLVLGWFTDKSSALKSTASLGSPSTLPV